MATLTIPTARIFKPLLQPSRYKAAFGGRGSGKSRFFGGLVVERHLMQKGCRSVCIREIQKDLKHSAKALIEDRLQEYSLGEAQGFKVYQDRIATPGDGIIIFNGMQSYNADSIKSLEDFHTAWIEEAQTFSAESLRLLRPSIRANDSEIWFSWNPRRKIDPVDVFFRGNELPTDALIVKSNWDDNPWFPYTLERERLDDLRIDPDGYPHTWEGEYATVTSGAYYARYIQEARAQQRIGHVGQDRLMSYRAFWDIGGTGAKADACSIWIAQFIGMECRVIDYYEAQGQPLQAHINWIKSQGYGDAQIYLPHDGIKHDFVYDVTYESALKDAGFEVEVIPNQGTGAAAQRIESGRRVWPNIWINEERCVAGLDALGWYHEKKDDYRNVGLGPEHDWSSHAADAFGLMCLVYEQERKTSSNRNMQLDYSMYKKIII
jgi:phage terminase large subunit